MSNTLFLVNVLAHNIWFFDNKPIPWLSFLHSWLRWRFQERSSCKIIPRYFTGFDSSIFCQLMRKFRHLVIILFLVLNNTISVLLVLRDNFALIQSTMHFKSLLMYLFIFLSDLSISNKLVSSAKWWTELFSIAWWRLLINIIKRKGPKKDPCGTPYSVSFSFDMIPL